MIYLDNEQIIVPNFLDVDCSTYSIELKNIVTNEIFTLDSSNISDNKLYYQFGIDASSLPSNEYEITIYDTSSNVLGCWLAQKGIGTALRTYFDSSTTYIEFE